MKQKYIATVEIEVDENLINLDEESLKHFLSRAWHEWQFEVGRTRPYDKIATSLKVHHILKVPHD